MSQLSDKIQSFNPEIYRKLNEWDSFKKDLSKYFLQIINDIKDGKFDKNMFVISKTLSREYKNPESVCHVALSIRL